MCCWHLQDSTWFCSMHGVWHGEKFCCGRFDFECVHMQRRNNGIGWRGHVRIMCCWQIQDTTWIHRVHGVCHRQTLDNHRLNLECVHMQPRKHRIHWFWRLYIVCPWQLPDNTRISFVHTMCGREILGRQWFR